MTDASLPPDASLPAERFDDVDDVGPEVEALDPVLERSRALGFLGPGPIAVHRAHALAALPLLREVGDRGLAVDLGSGGGVPGLVLAAALPGWQWLLLDANERRTTFLQETVTSLGWAQRVEVWRGRAEEAGSDPSRRGQADVVIARSFAPPAVTAECGAPLLRIGGILVVSEPPARPARWDGPALTELGFDPEPVAHGPWIAFRLARATPEAYPRPVGRPAKRPLWTI